MSFRRASARVNLESGMLRDIWGNGQETTRHAYGFEQAEVANTKVWANDDQGNERGEQMGLGAGTLHHRWQRG